MYRFTRLIIFIVLFVPVKGHSQHSSDSVVIVYFKSGKFILDIIEERMIFAAMNDSSRSIQIKEISSYADSVGTVQDNMLLAQKRSEHVFEILSVLSQVEIFTANDLSLV